MFNFKFTKTHAKVAGGTAAGGLMMAAVALISPFEGYYGHTYKDIVGVKTVCYGETDKAAVTKGQTYTFSKAECQAMLGQSLVKYDDGMMRCLHKPITDNAHVAFLSTTYNIGIAGFCRSSMARLVNAGNLKGACNALRGYNHAGGRAVKGLTTRRLKERELCLRGL